MSRLEDMGKGKIDTMSLKQTLKDDLTAAMKARDELTVSTLRLALSSITTAEVAGTELVELTDQQVLDVLKKEAKKRAESAEIYENNDRTEMAAKERAELTVIARYLPAAMSDTDLAVVVAEEVANAASAGNTGGKAMGAVIKAVRERVGDKADGGRISAAVKAALA